VARLVSVDRIVAVAVGRRPELLALDADTPPAIRLRLILKDLLRRHRYRCIKVEPVPDEPTEPACQSKPPTC
jgi:hypothetical protein